MPRTHMINLRADDDEVAIMQAAADAAGVKLGTWVREVALQSASPAELAPAPSSETDPMLAFYRGFSLGVSYRDEQRQAPWWRFWQRWQPGQRQQQLPELTAAGQIADGAVVDAVYTG